MTRIASTTLALFLSTTTFAQQPPARPAAPQPNPATRTAGRPQGPTVRSPELHPDRRITFRVLAPKADDVRLNAGDIQGGGPRQFTKGENGVWELTVAAVVPGTYRYTFNVDGVPVVDPRNPATSESNNNVWSVIHVPGLAVADQTDVPHGAVAAVHYNSKTLGKPRRMHVYTPPGYEQGNEKYPVLYLLHGSSDSDDSWVSVGRANFILDNLIAAKKAKPMIVVMPAGHTSNPLSPPASRPAASNEFDNDLLKDIRPYVESHYRVLTDRPNRAITGLSMGGGQSLSVALPNLRDFGYVGVFSAGLFQRNLADWEQQNAGMLDDAQSKEGLKLLWLATGKDDFLMPRTKETVDLLKRHGFNPVFKETPGGHTWLNWRNYLDEFVPQLFQ